MIGTQKKLSTGWATTVLYALVNTPGRTPDEMIDYLLAT